MQKQTQTDDFGDFEEIKEESNQSSDNTSQEQQALSRVRMPRDKELIGVIVQRLGGNRMDVKTTDGKIRNCRVPGRYRRKLWLRPKNIVIIIPDEYNDNKGDIIYKYLPAAVSHLKRKGILDSLNEDF